MPYLKHSGNKVLFGGDGEMLYFIPESYFSRKLAFQVGETMNLLGIFTYAVFNKSGKMVKTDLFKFPTMFQCKPSYITKEKEYLLKGSKTKQDYRILHFKSNDELVCDIYVPAVTENIEKFMNLLIAGGLPDNIPYNTVHEYVLENASLNNFGYEVSPQIIGIFLSELYRDPNDLTKPFRVTGSSDMTNYKMISIKKVPKYTSPYTAITSENADDAIAGAINTKGKVESPLEKVMMN